MTSQNFDVAIIGSGPGGCTAGTLLAQKGYDVVLIEREKFPRFHVGESLLPATQEIWERMGFAEQMQHQGYTFKYGGGFRFPDEPQKSSYKSATVFFERLPKQDQVPRPFAYQVERARFDKQLQDFAKSQGVTVWEQTAVEEVIFDEASEPGARRARGVRVRRPDKQKEEVTADFVIDASGRRCLIARQLDCIEPDPEVKTSAVFGHFRGVKREPGYKQGLFVGYFIENGWFWFIPLADDVMSVGLVQNEPATHSWSNDPEEVLLDAINRYQFIRDLFEDAVQVGRVRSIRNIPYRTQEFCGDGWMSIGDANFFVDPLYSSGVHVAHSTGEKAAQVVDEFLSNGRDMRPIEEYRRYILKYRRNVFGTIYAVYRLLRHWIAIRTFGWLAGERANDFDTWLLRRVVSWTSGHFNRHVWVMRFVEYFGKTIARIVPAIARLWGGDGWKRFEQHRLEAPPLQIPKENHSPESKNAATTEAEAPPTPQQANATV